MSVDIRISWGSVDTPAQARLHRPTRCRKVDLMKFSWRYWTLTLILMFSIGLLTGMKSAYARDRVETTGDILAIAIPGLGLGTTLLDEHGHEGSLQFFESFASAQLTTEALKLITHKERPNGSCCKSFPSGHTSAAFMGASFIHKRYGLDFAIPAYIAAAYVGYTRVHAKKHYRIDVVAGAAIGILSSYYFTESYKGFDLSASNNDDTYWLNVSKTW